MYSVSSTFYAQNPALEIVDQQKSVAVYLHIVRVQRGCSAEEAFMRSILCYAHTMYRSRLCAKNPVFEIVHGESVKDYHLYTYMYNGNIPQNPLCVESCVTKELPISPRKWYFDWSTCAVFYTPEPELMHLAD